MAGAAGDNGAEFIFTSAVRGFHEYRRIWKPHLGQHLNCKREHGNPKDRFAVAVTRAGDDDAVIVGHLPRECSRILWYFISHGGEVFCEVTGKRQRSPLAQGGLEIPCTVTLRGKKKMVAAGQQELQKVHQRKN